MMDELFFYFLFEGVIQAFGHLWPRRKKKTKEKPAVVGRPSVPLVPPPAGWASR
jgi:hypothetical protein